MIHKWYDGIKDVLTKVMLDFIYHPIVGKLHTSEGTTESKWFPKEDVLKKIEALIFL